MSQGHKYYFEIDTGGAEASGYEDRLPWVSYGTIIAEGDTLDECLDNATVDLIDQDGGERGQVDADENWMQDLIVESYYGRMGDAPKSGETPGDFRSRMDRKHMWITAPSDNPNWEEPDPTPWCGNCGAQTSKQCDCLPRAEND